MEPTQSLLSMDLQAGQDDWTPTPHGQFLASVLASTNLVEGKSVLELGAGVANHTILLHRKGARRIVATEITEDLLETTRSNFVANCGTDAPLELRVADWLHTHGQFDLIVSNPPFCKSGKQNRRYYLDSLILDGHKRLNPGGEILFVQSSMADIARSLRFMEANGFRARELGRTQGPFRDYYFEDATFLEEMERVDNAYEVRDGKRYETLAVLHGKLRPYTPPAGAHLPGQDSGD